MHIAKVPNRNARPSYLLRETYREDGKVKNRTLANLSKLPVERIETLRAALRGDPLAPIGDNGLEIRRSLPHGHVLAALATARRIGLDDLLPRRAPQRRRDLALALIVARLLDPAARLATARMLDSATASHSLGDMAEITSPDYPGDRLVVCKNPLLAEERRRKRDELLALTEADLLKIQARVVRENNPLRGAGEIGTAVGAVLDKRKMAKHFALTITDAAFAFTRKDEAIAEEARFDGFYVLRSSLSAEQIDAAGTVRAYKSLAQVERAFRCMKTLDLELRPVFHWTPPRVRAHVLLCMLAYYLEWHMRQPLAPMLFDDHDGASAEAERTSPVAKAKVSKAAYRKASTQRVDGDDGGSYPVHSFRTLLADLATLSRNTVCFAGQKMLTVQTTATPLQRQALSLLGVELAAA